MIERVKSLTSPDFTISPVSLSTTISGPAPILEVIIGFLKAMPCYFLNAS